MAQHVIPETTAQLVLVTGGTGFGSTELTAFDAALQDAGIHDANLIRISSITPAGAETQRPAPQELADQIEPGAYIPAVYSWKASEQTGQRVYAAVAGGTLEEGYGINVEDHGIGDEEEVVRERCRTMLEEMAERRGSALSDTWVRYETLTIPESTDCGAAVAAIVYTR